MSDLSEFYQELILDHNRNPRNCRTIQDADRTAEGYNPLCGDRITVFLNLDGDVVREVAFEGSGCAISTAAASLMTESLTGKTIDEAMAMFQRFHDLVTGESCENQEDRNLGKLAVFSGVRQYPARVKCATLAWHTIKAALDSHVDDVVTTE